MSSHGYRFRITLPCVAALAGALVFGAAGPARAAFELKISAASGGYSADVTGPSAAGATFSGGIGGTGISDTSILNIKSAFGDSTSPGGANTLAEVGSLKITNNSGVDQTITIQVSAQDFMIPTSPPPVALVDTVSGTVATGTASGSVQAYADTTNALFGTNFSDPGLNLTIPTTAGTSSFAVNGASTGSFSPNGAPYSLTFVETITLSAGASLTLTGGNVSTAPAPASLLAALTALPCLGIGGWLRRRKQTA